MLYMRLESKRPGAMEFGIRNRLDDLNFAFHSGLLSITQLIDAAIVRRNRWIFIEPETEFRLVVLDPYSSCNGLAEKAASMLPKQNAA